MTVLTAFAALSVCRFGDGRQLMLRQDDSVDGSLLSGVAESDLLRAMTNAPSALPHDVHALRALILAERSAHAATHAAIIAERDQLAVRNAKLEQILAEMRRAMFGRRSEKANPGLKAERTQQRRKSRNDNLDHLPHEEVVIEPNSKVCPCCGGELHVIGEDTSKRLDKQPAKLTVVVTRR